MKATTPTMQQMKTYSVIPADGSPIIFTVDGIDAEHAIRRLDRYYGIRLADGETLAEQAN